MNFRVGLVAQLISDCRGRFWFSSRWRGLRLKSLKLATTISIVSRLRMCGVVSARTHTSVWRDGLLGRGIYLLSLLLQTHWRRCMYIYS